MDISFIVQQKFCFSAFFFIKYRKINRLQKFLPYLVPHIQLPRKKDPFFCIASENDMNIVNFLKKNIFLA